MNLIIYISTQLKMIIISLKNKILDTKLMTNRQEIAKKMKNDLIHNPQNNFYYSNLFKKKL